MILHSWDADEWFHDLFYSPTFGMLWWDDIETHKKLSDVAVLKITGKPIEWHEELMVELLNK